MLRHLKKLLPRPTREFIDRTLATERRRRENACWRGVDDVLRRVDTVDEAAYAAWKGFEEPEHQIGRFRNMRRIVREIEAGGYPGDVVEFGTWQGLGLCLLDRCFQGPHAKRFVGIDSFEGLPETSTVWSKGQFNDTSLGSVHATLAAHLRRTPDYRLIRGWFSDPEVGRQLREAVRDVALVHFDADLKSSTTEALALVEPYLAGRKEPVFFLFDDWGCHPDEVPDAFHEWCGPAADRHGFRAEKIGSTRFTRYYRLTFA